MRVCLITFRSVTPAQRAEGILRKADYTCILQRTPKWMEEQGCGYSLRLRQFDLQEAVELLRSHGIPYRKTYLQRESGTLEEIQV